MFCDVTRLAVGVAVVSGLLSACTKRNPAYCESNADCANNDSATHCDVDGSLEGTANACVEPPLDLPDASIAIDAGSDDACVPTTCAAAGKNCGEIDDGCGTPLQCGACVLPLACGALGTDNVCEGNCVSGEWTLADIETGATDESARNPGLAIAPDGTLHAAYGYKPSPPASPSTQLRQSQKTLTSWAVDQVDTGSSPGEAGRGACIAVDVANTVHIGYGRSFPEQVWTATLPAGGSWVTAFLSGDYIESCSLMAAPDGMAHIFFSPAAGHAQRSLGAAWSGIDTSLPVAVASVAVDGSGALHVVYYDAPAQMLRYATSLGALRWTSEDIASAATDPAAAIAVTKSGDPHVAFVAGGNKYARRTSAGEWSIESISAIASVTLSIAIDPTDGVHVAYDGSGPGLLHAVRLAKDTWSTSGVDPSFDAGRDYKAMVIDGAGGVHIAYTTPQPGELKYGYRCP